jgi:uncharacterized protein (UPF0548 family)
MTRMSVQQLGQVQAARLLAAPYTYAPVGQSASEPPPGFQGFERSRQLARRDYERAADDLFRWRLHTWSGLRVSASDVPLRAGTVVLMRLGVGPVALRIPCRVVYVVDEADLRGFAYGTLPGHPEAGEERFMLRRHGGGSVELTVSAFSRPASALAKLGGPLSRRAQELTTDRYLHALDRAE